MGIGGLREWIRFDRRVRGDGGMGFKNRRYFRFLDHSRRWVRGVMNGAYDSDTEVFPNDRRQRGGESEKYRGQF